MKCIGIFYRAVPGLAIGLAMLIASTTTVLAQEPSLEDQLAEIVLQIQDELNLIGAPTEIVDRCSTMVANSQATGLDRVSFLANLADELTGIVENESSLQFGLEAVDALVAEYQDLAGGA